MNTFPSFPDAAFPNTITVRLCEDAIGREGGANPVPATGVSFSASVQERGARYDTLRNASVTDYAVYFQSDPTATLSRPIRAGDEILWGAVVITATGPAVDRGGFGWLWRVRGESVTT